MNIKVKKLHPNAIIPKYMTAGAAGFDLHAIQGCSIEPGENVRIPLGLSFEIPEGYVLYICMRSGIALKTNLRQSNGIGVIDSDYRGEVSMLFDNIAKCTSMTDFQIYTEHIHKGDRICQGIIAPVQQAIFVETDELTTTERGAGGFGSTGSAL